MTRAAVVASDAAAIASETRPSSPSTSAVAACLPLATVAAIEFVAAIVVALVGVRSLRNVAALIVAVTGVFLLIGFQWSGDRLGVLLAIANAPCSASTS